MKTLFIKAKSKTKIDLSKVNLKRRIGLVTTVQFEDELKKIKDKRFIFGGSILGCDISNALKIENKVDCFLFVGSGAFHVIGLALEVNKPVYILNPHNNKIKKISEEEIESYNKIKKGKLLKFYNAENVGILVSLKKGQYHPKKYLNLKEKLKIADELKKKIKKKSYIFLFDILREEELENFQFIDIWINTACPRIEGRNIINLQDLKLNG